MSVGSFRSEVPFPILSTHELPTFPLPRRSCLPVRRSTPHVTARPRAAATLHHFGVHLVLPISCRGEEGGPLPPWRALTALTRPSGGWRRPPPASRCCWPPSAWTDPGRRPIVPRVSPLVSQTPEGAAIREPINELASVTEISGPADRLSFWSTFPLLILHTRGCSEPCSGRAELSCMSSLRREMSLLCFVVDPSNRNCCRLVAPQKKPPRTKFSGCPESPKLAQQKGEMQWLRFWGKRISSVQNIFSF